MTETPINWTALRHDTGDVPWEAVENAIAAVAGEPGSWEGLADVYWQSVDANSGFVGLYVPVILGEAGSRLADSKDRSVRERIEAFLLKGLLDGWDRGDDFALAAFQYACGRMGPAILPQVLRRIKGAPADRETCGELWALLALAGRSTDAELRAAIARRCLVRVENVLKGVEEAWELLEPLHVLAALRWAEAQPILERLGREKADELQEADLEADYAQVCRAIQDETDQERAVEIWEEGWREFVGREFKHWRKWYESEAKPEQGGGNRVSEADWDSDPHAAAEGLSRDWAQQFAVSSQASELPPELREDASARAAMMLYYGMIHVGPEPGDWGIAGWHELLCEVLPRKVTADAEWFAGVAPTAGILLRWLDAAGLMVGGAALALTVEQWGPDVAAAAKDPRNWGMAKNLMMQAYAEGVDLEDEHQLAGFVTHHNARQDQRRPLLDGASTATTSHWLPAPPFVHAEPKVGRNDPCPCGSGKKYKKCCGR